MLHYSAALSAAVLIFTGVLGAVFGSFAVCTAARIVSGESFLKGRSHCDHCGHVLSVADLVPVFSWLFLRGRCRYCGARISPRCPIMELLSIALCVGIVLRYDVTFLAAQNLILTVLLLIMALVDADIGIIPNKLLLAIFLDFLIWLPYTSAGNLWLDMGSGLLSGLCASVPLLIISLILDRLLKRESMGGGDIKLFFVIGLFFPIKCILFLLIVSCLFGIVFALVRKKDSRQSDQQRTFPFGPAIAAGTYLSLLAAEPAVTAYLHLFDLT
jgi:prepilin signal peptidase PulO-like enzyme (type II secretory pathway)